MDSFNFNIKVQKANAIKKHRQLQKLAGLLRLFEICLVLSFLSSFSIQLPFAVKGSSGYFKNLTLNLLSPRFIFVVGNVIVITLFVKSGKFSGQDRNGKGIRNDLYEEFIEKSEKIHRPVVENRGKQESSVFHHVVVEETTNTCGTMGEKHYERSQSENFRRPKHVRPVRELRRSATESCKDTVAVSVEGWKKSSLPEDGMSNEEFKSTIEAFIERQKRFRRDEENSVF